MKQTQTTEVSDTRQQAYDFAKKYGIKLTILDEDFRPYFDDDKTSRSVFKCRLSRNGKSYTFSFGQSIANTGQHPDIYDILACLTKYDPGTFENFCNEFGYHTDSRKAEKTYKAVCREYKAVERMFSDILDELAEIW